MLLIPDWYLPLSMLPNVWKRGFVFVFVFVFDGELVIQRQYILLIPKINVVLCYVMLCFVIFCSLLSLSSFISIHILLTLSFPIPLFLSKPHPFNYSHFFKMISFIVLIIMKFSKQNYFRSYISLISIIQTINLNGRKHFN